MSKKTNPSSSQNIFATVLKTIQANVNFPALRFKKGAKVPKIIVKYGENGTKEDFSLLGDRYIIGKSSRDCDIPIRNPFVSSVHCTLVKHRRQNNCFVVTDNNSTNGIYSGKKRYKFIPLRHGDKITLGPPELEDAVEITYFYPPAMWVLIIRYFLYFSAIAFFLIIIGIGIEWTKYKVYPLPHGVPGPVIIYADDGKTPLTPKYELTHQELDNLASFSPYLRQAVIASEDSRFYWHFGVDPIGISRAILINVEKDGLKQGASTITQQLARSIIPSVGRDNTFDRKLREMFVALKLEAVYSKDEILKTYLNRVFLGVNNYGFEDAAQFYFEKSARDLDINEAATLTAMLPAPNSYNPVQDYNTTIKNRNLVLERMLDLRMITKEDADRTRRSRIEVSPKARQTLSNIIAPYFYSYVFSELTNLLGDDVAKEGDFWIETGLNPDMQQKAETALKEYIKTSGKKNHFSQGAIVTLNTKTGEILALVGGEDYSKSQFNRATQAQRQPGSTFKVFAYASAIENDISPYKTYSCNGLRWGGVSYKPCERSSGSVTMMQGIAQSENAIALRVTQDVGLKTRKSRDKGLDMMMEMATRLGIKSKLTKAPGLVLGQSESNVLEMTGAYATFANLGIWNPPHGIKTIRDGRSCQDSRNYKTCEITYSFNKNGDESKQVIKPYVAQTMTTMMQEVFKSGTARSAYLGKGEAGKTGTTNRGVDLWFIGYIPQKNLVTGIWLGNDDNSPTNSSSIQAVTLWKKYMTSIIMENG